MIQPERKPDVTDYTSMAKFLRGIMVQVKTKEVSVDEADAISKIADKAVKLELVNFMYQQKNNPKAKIDFFETESSKMLLSKKIK